MERKSNSKEISSTTLLRIVQVYKKKNSQWATIINIQILNSSTIRAGT